MIIFGEFNKTSPTLSLTQRIFIASVENRSTITLHQHHRRRRHHRYGVNDLTFAYTCDRSLVHNQCILKHQ